MRLWQMLSMPFRRGPRRPLAARRPGKATHDVPLGMEALDLRAVDAVNRRNNALERVTGAPGGRDRRPPGFFLGTAETDVAELPDDETYAARYHRAFQDKEIKR